MVKIYEKKWMLIRSILEVRIQKSNVIKESYSVVSWTDYSNRY